MLLKSTKTLKAFCHMMLVAQFARNVDESNCLCGCCPALKFKDFPLPSLSCSLLHQNANCLKKYNKNAFVHVHPLAMTHEVGAEQISNRLIKLSKPA